jgi:hypothetical protein
LTDATTQYLQALTSAHPRGLVDLRICRRDGGGARRRFFSVTDIAGGAAHARITAAHSDVYVGVAVRARPEGGRTGVDAVWTLWADCDDARATERLQRFTPAPSIVVRSGSEHGRHAYWLLDRPLTPAEAELANRRLARALGADLRSTDAARVLRPPGTLNHKYDPPASVELERLTARRHRAPDVVGELPEPPRLAHRLRANTSDALRSIPPAVYIERLTGVPVPRSRKIRCPFHDDDRPSLHVYAEAERGWFCFGCRRGGSVYDFAAALWHLGTRGADFRRLHVLVCDRLGTPAAA